MYMMQIDISIFLFYYNIKKILPIIVATHSDSGMKVKHTFEKEFQYIPELHPFTQIFSVQPGTMSCFGMNPFKCFLTNYFHIFLVTF